MVKPGTGLPGWGAGGMHHLELISVFLKLEAKRRLPARLLRAQEWVPT